MKSCKVRIRNDYEFLLGVLRLSIIGLQLSLSQTGVALNSVTMLFFWSGRNPSQHGLTPGEDILLKLCLE